MGVTGERGVPPPPATIRPRATRSGTSRTACTGSTERGPRRTSRTSGSGRGSTVPRAQPGPPARYGGPVVRVLPAVAPREGRLLVPEHERHHGDGDERRVPGEHRLGQQQG